MQAKVPAPLSVAAVDSPVQVAVSFIPVSSIETGLVEYCQRQKAAAPVVTSCRLTTSFRFSLQHEEQCAVVQEILWWRSTGFTILVKLSRVAGKTCQPFPAEMKRLLFGAQSHFAEPKTTFLSALLSFG